MKPQNLLELESFEPKMELLSPLVMRGIQNKTLLEPIFEFRPKVREGNPFANLLKRY